MNKYEIINKLNTFCTRSAWTRGVIRYAVGLIDAVEKDDITLDDVRAGVLLNGAQNWTEYSYGGCALISDRDIAAALCTPSELKRTRNGERNPNSRENWLDVQARALSQAERKIKQILAKKK